MEFKTHVKIKFIKKNKTRAGGIDGSILFSVFILYVWSYVVWLEGGLWLS